MSIPNRKDQIIQAHAVLIVGVVKAAQNPAERPAIDEALNVSEQNGWGDLVKVLRKILDGSRDLGMLAALDEEDSTIAESVLLGLQNPATLPDPDAKPDATMAAPGLAHMIHEATKGQAQALQLLAGMAEQMTSAGGDMAQIGGIMRRLVNGERDPNELAKKMGPQGESLLLAILEELGKLEAH